MKLFSACLLICQLAVSTLGQNQCSCTERTFTNPSAVAAHGAASDGAASDGTAANGTAANGTSSANTDGATNTDNATTMTTAPMPDNATTTATPTVTDAPEASVGPSSGPSDRLLQDFFNERKLGSHADTSSDDAATDGAAEGAANGTEGNGTATTMAPDEDECSCPPVIETVFTSVLTFDAATDLSSFDPVAFGNDVKTEAGWEGEVDVVVLVTFTSAFSFTFPAGSEIDGAACVSAVAAAFDGVEANQVTCAAGTAGNATGDAAANESADGGAGGTGRRLQEVMAVTITSDNAAGAQAVRTSASAEGLTLTVGGVESTEVSAVVTTAEVEITVLSDDDIEELSAANLVASLPADIREGATAEEPEREVLASTACSSQTCPTGQTLIAAAGSTEGSDAATCCIPAPAPPASTSGTQSTSVLGSLSFLALSYNFIF